MCQKNGTSVRRTIGTARYVAPEQLCNIVDDSGTFECSSFVDLLQADIYSVSLVIWEILISALGNDGYSLTSLAAQAHQRTSNCINTTPNYLLLNSTMFYTDPWPKKLHPVHNRAVSPRPGRIRGKLAYLDAMPRHPNYHDAQQCVVKQQQRPTVFPHWYGEAVSLPVGFSWLLQHTVTA